MVTPSPAPGRVLTEHHEGVTVLVLDRPPVNALSPAFARALHAAWQSAQNDPGCLAVVVAASGRCFSVGADLNAFARHYDLEAASGEALDLQKRVVKEHGLGVWLTTLTAAARKSTKENRAMTWEHVLNAHAFFRKQEQTTNEEAA